MIKKVIKKIISLTRDNPNVGDFLSANEVIKNARSEGLSVPDFIDKMSDDPRKTGRVCRVLNFLQNYVDLKDSGISVLEIGPGTGRYLDGMLARNAKIARYEIYETADDWRRYLEKTYSDYFVEFISRRPDAISLKSTLSSSVDLVHAHAVFVYLRPLHVMRYILEMARVCRKGGHLLFDYLPDQQLYGNGVNSWIDGVHDWPVFFSDQVMNDFTANNGLKLVAQTDEVYGHGISRYICLRKM